MAISKRLRFEILRRDGHTCRYCGRSAPEVKLTVDHVKPEALGGRTEPDNLVTACGDCNSGKTSIAPDSPLVDQVAEDALRWSRAMSAAASRMVADLAARDAWRAEFETAWNAWKFKGLTAPLPEDWRESVDRFMAAGLPMPVLLDCIPPAMRNDKVNWNNIFRYMCGVAWHRVGELQEAAKAETAPAADAPPDPAIQLAAELLNQVSDMLGDDYLADVIEDVRAEGIPPREQLVECARSVVDKLTMRVAAVRAGRN